MASLELFNEEGSLDRVHRLERLYHERAASLRDHPHIGEVRILGGIMALELVRDREQRAADGYLDRVGPELTAQFLDRGLLLRPLGNILYFMPPYVITDDEAHWAIDQIDDVLKNWRWPQSVG